MGTAGRAWIARLLEALLLIAAAMTIVVLALGGFSFRVGPIRVLVTNAVNPALFVVLLALLRIVLGVSTDRLIPLLARAIEWGTFALLALAPFHNLRSVSSATAIALFALLILQWLLTRRSPVRKTPLLWPSVALTAASLAAALSSSSWSYDTTEFVRGSGVYLTVFVAATAGFRDERAARRLLIVGAASLACVLAIGFVRLASGADERFVAYLDWYAKAGLYLAVVLPIVGGALLATRSAPGRAALGALLIAGLIGLAMTMSRGAWVAAAAAAIVFALLVERRLFIVFFASALVAWIALPVSYRARVFSIVEFQRYMESGPTAPLGNRSIAWRCGLEMAGEHPLLGSGPGERHFQETFAQKPYAKGAAEDVKHAHNVYLQLLVETGIIGLAAFLWVLVTMTILAVRRWRRAESAWSRGIAAGIAASLSALWVYGFSDHYYSCPHGEVTTLFWMLGVVLVALAPSATDPVERTTSRIDAGRAANLASTSAQA